MFIIVESVLFTIAIESLDYLIWSLPDIGIRFKMTPRDEERAERNKTKLRKFFKFILRKYDIKEISLEYVDYFEAVSYGQSRRIVMGLYFKRFTCAQFCLCHEIGHILLKDYLGVTSSKIIYIQKIIEYACDFIGVFMVIDSKRNYVPLSITMQFIPKLLGTGNKGLVGILVSDHPEDCCRVLYIAALELILFATIKIIKLMFKLI